MEPQEPKKHLLGKKHRQRGQLQNGENITNYIFKGEIQLKYIKT